MLLSLISRHTPPPLPTDDAMVQKRRHQQREKVRFKFCKALTLRVRRDLIEAIHLTLTLSLTLIGFDGTSSRPSNEGQG